jgi:hypothetical protein
MRPEQMLVFDAMARTSPLSLTLADDADAEALTMSRVSEVPGGQGASGTHRRTPQICRT